MVIPKAYAISAPDVLIVELQVRSNADTGAADHEFVELYNTTPNPVDVSTWKLQYKSATGSSWSDKVTLHGSIAPGSHYLLVSDKFPNPPVINPGDPALALDVFKAGLSDSGGHVRIADFTVPALPIVHDTLGWGSTANAAEGKSPAAAPAGGKSLKRRVNADGGFQDTDNNANDFEVSSEPSPQADPLYVAPVSEPDPDPAPSPDPSPAPEPDSGGGDEAATDVPAPPDDPLPPVTDPQTPPMVMLPPQITELLPNPAAPASDSTDEFIEIYNPNDQPLPIQSYKLQSGNTFSYSYTFPDTTLAPHEYKAFLVTETGDILSNTSGQARILDTSGDVVGQTNSYDNATEGQAWANINGAWQWTTTPTPNEPNVLTLDVPSVGVVKGTSKASPKTTAAKTTAPKAATTKSTSSAKTVAAKTPKATATADRQVYQDPAATPASVHPSILAGVGVITLLYAAYEYRYDAINTFRKFRRYREVRRAARPSATGR